MPSTEYSKLHTEDIDSLSRDEEVAHQHLCQKCLADINQVAENRGTVRRIFAGLSLFKIIAFILLVTANLGTIGLWWRQSPTVTDCVRPLLSYSPAKADGALEYKKSRLTVDIDANVYTGPPRPVHDEAWSRLPQPIAIKISKDELHQLGENSIEFADGSGYVAELSVYHELHCIKRLRRHRYLDHYYPNMTTLQRYREDIHYDHCLEYWREAAMCRGDTSLATFIWRDGRPVSRVYNDRECVNWEKLDMWARTRMTNLSDISILRHE
ncbi:hypothetical protein ACMFMF_003831 [Clarireedia jacksonii]